MTKSLVLLGRLLESFQCGEEVAMPPVACGEEGSMVPQTTELFMASAMRSCAFILSSASRNK